MSEFGLTASNPNWPIAADWISDVARDEAEEVTAAAFRAGLWTPTVFVLDGNGYGDG